MLTAARAIRSSAIATTTATATVVSSTVEEQVSACVIYSLVLTDTERKHYVHIFQKVQISLMKAKLYQKNHLCPNNRLNSYLALAQNNLPHPTSARRIIANISTCTHSADVCIHNTLDPRIYQWYTELLYHKCSY